MGPLGGEPRAVGQPNGAIDVFWRGTDRQLWHAWFADGRWNGGNAMGGSVTDDPSPPISSPGNVEVYWKSANGTLDYARGPVSRLVRARELKSPPAVMGDAISHPSPQRPWRAA